MMWSDAGFREDPPRYRSFNVEVVAVRWSCCHCDRTVIGRPGSLPADWFEWPAPPWRSWDEPSFACPDHASEARRLHAAQWASLNGRQFSVSAEEYERVKQELRQVSALLDRLRNSGERASDRYREV
jgi:hypothetical protein